MNQRWAVCGVVLTLMILLTVVKRVWTEGFHGSGGDGGGHGGGHSGGHSGGHGGMRGGHYAVAILRNDVWYLKDDETVTKLSEPPVQGHFYMVWYR